MTTPRTPGAPVALDIASLDGVSGGNREGVPPPAAGRNFEGSDGNEVIYAGSGDDTINAHGGDDAVFDGRGNDVIHLGAGDDRLMWHPHPGHDLAQGGAGTDTLVLNNYDISREDLLAAITPDPGSAAPFIDENGMISLAGVTGTITIGDATLTFSGFERMFVNA